MKTTSQFIQQTAIGQVGVMYGTPNTFQGLSIDAWIRHHEKKEIFIIEESKTNHLIRFRRLT